MKTNDQPLQEMEDLRERLKKTEETLHDLRYSEEMVRKSDQEKTAILNSLSEEITYLDTDMRVLWTNRTANESAGLAPEQIVGLHCYDVWCQNGEPRVGCPTARTIKTGQQGMGEISIPDGRTFLQRSYPTRDTTGNLASAVVITLDITEHKQAEKVLRERENAYRTLAENLPGMVYRVFLRENNRMEFFNKMLQPMTGYAVEELTAGEVCSIEPLILREDREALVITVKRAILDCQPFEVEYRLRTKGGETRYLLERGRPIYGADAKPLYIDGVILDITARKVAEEALRKANQEKEVILNAMTEAMGLINTNLRGVWANKACAEHAGLPPEEMVGRYCYEMWAHRTEPCVGCPILKTIETGRPEEAEIPSPDGRIWLHRGYAVQSANGLIESVVATALDITERKQFEEKLEEHAQVLNQIHDSVISTDLEGHVVTWNKGAERIFGYSAEEAFGKHISFVYPQDQHQFLQDEVIWPLKKKWRHEVEAKMRRKSGEDFYAHLSLSMLRNKEGLEIGMIGSSVDLTERRQMEEVLLFKENIIKHSSSVIATCDLEGNMTYGNPSFLKTWGFNDPEEFLGRPFWEFWLVEDRIDEVMHALRGDGAWFGEIKARRKDGAIFDVQVSAAMVFDSRGTPVALTSTSIVITERKRMEDQIRRSRDELEIRVQERTAELYQANQNLLEKTELLEKLFSTINIMIAYMDRDFNFLRVNRALAEDDGRPPEFFVGKNLFDLFPDVNRQDFEAPVKTGEPISGYEKPFLHPKHPERGVTYWDWSVQPVKDPEGTVAGVVASFANVTERKHAEQALRESEKRLRFLSSQLITVQEQERKRIASELHESLAALLSGIKYKVEAALQQRAKNKLKAEENQLESVIPMIQESVEEVRRIQTGLRPVTLDSLGVLATLRGMCRKFQTTYPFVSIQQQSDIEEGEVPPSLKIVIYRISQEALNNVAKHSEADLVHISVRKREAKIELIIQDNGQGFDVNEALSREGSERGLGLTSMRERAELSGGLFTIESAAGKGTTIHAAWPCPPPSPSPSDGGGKEWG